MKWLYWILATFLYFYQFVFRSLFGTLGDELTAYYHLSVDEFSTFLSSAMLSYALMQIPAGILLDYLGVRKMLSLAMAMLSGGVLLISMGESFGMAVTGRVLMGIGSSFSFLGTAKVITSWFSLAAMPFLLGTTVFVGSLGGAFSYQIFHGLHVGEWDWRFVLFAMSIVGIASLVCYVGMLRDGKPAQSEAKRRRSLLAEIVQLLGNRQVMIAALFASFVYLPISIIADSWGVIGFEKIFAASHEEAAHTLMYFYISYAFGNLWYSGVATVTRKPRTVLIVAIGGMLIALYCLLMHVELGRTNIVGHRGFLILTAAFAFNVGAMPLIFSVACSHVGQQLTASTVGIVNMFCMISGSLYAKLLGWLLIYYWDGGSTVEGVALYSAEAYLKAFQPLVAATAIAWGLLFLLREGRGMHAPIDDDLVA